MLRKEQEISEKEEIEGIIQHAQVCRLALSENDHPYIVPLCFGYSHNTFYFHCARKGRKINIIRDNPNTCIEIDVNTKIMEDEKACQWGMKYKSIIAFGKAVIIDDLSEKEKALHIIMRQYSSDSFSLEKKFIDKCIIIKVIVDKITGKKSNN